MSVPFQNPSSIVIVYTLALGAIYTASYRGLTKHIKRLQPDKDDEEEEMDSKLKEVEDVKDTVSTASEAESQPAKEESKPKSKWEKWQDGLATAGMICAMWAVGFILAFGLPKIATPGILDIIWMFLIGCQMWIVYQELIANILPDPRCWTITWSRWNIITSTKSKTEYLGPTPRTTPRMVVAGISTLATLAGVYTGTEWVIAFPIAALVYVAVSSIIVNDRSVRSTLKWLVVIQAGLVVFVGLIMGGFWVYRLYSHSSTVQTKPKSPDSQPSQEVQMLTAMFSSCIPLVVSGYLIGLSLRFDYTRALQSNIISAPPITSSTKFAKLPPYPKPFFKAALSTLVVIFFNFGLSQVHPSSKFKETGLIIYTLCIPATIVGVRMMIIAGKEGVWEEFMGYNELGTKALKEQQKDEKDVERLIDVQEKMSAELDSSL